MTVPSHEHGTIGMLSNSSHTLVVPSGAACFVGSPQAGDLTSSPCPVTSDMLQFLNLTVDFGAYFDAYCLNPPQGDGCPYGYCPNSEIAGPLSCPFSLRYSTDFLARSFRPHSCLPDEFLRR